MAREKGKCSMVFKAGAVCALLMFSLFLLCSCGGGGDDGGVTSTQGVTLSGTVAAGAPVTATSVKFRDINGKLNSEDITTDPNGRYVNVNITDMGLTPPVLIRVWNPGIGALYSYASKSGIANIHPLTDPIIRAWYRVEYKQADPNRDLDKDFFDPAADLDYPSQREIDFIKAVIKDLMKNLLAAVAEKEGLKDIDGNTVDVEDFDPMETPFKADSSGFDRILDKTQIDTSDDSGNLNIVVDPNSDLETDLEDVGGSTVITIDTDNIVEEDYTPPTVPPKPTAYRVSANQIFVTWSMDPNSDAAYYIVKQYGTVTGTKEIGIVISTAFIAPINPDVSQTYTYTIEACDAAGNHSGESEASDPIEVTVATVPAADTTDPIAGILYATPIGSDEIKLTWSELDPNGVADPNCFSDPNGHIVRYWIYACSDAGCTTPSLIAKIPSSPFVHFDRDPNTLYYYQIEAEDAAGNKSVPSNVASARTLLPPVPIDDTPPSAPGAFNAVASVDQVNLSWTKPGETDLAWYEIFRDGNSLAEINDKNVVSYVDTNLESETTYTYGIKAFDYKGNGSAYAFHDANTPDFIPPSVPTGVTAQADPNSTSRITITWTASTDADVAGYKVYRDSGISPIADVTGTSHADSGLNANTTYYYQVSAYDDAGNESAKSTQVPGTTSTTSAAVAVLIGEAKSSLEGQNISGAHDKFESAYALDPDDKDANFGLAITNAILLLEDPNLANFLDLYEMYKPTIENILYGALNNTYEVWGGDNWLCGSDALDPNAHGYTKLSDANSPETSFDGYAYYVVYATPFSDLNIQVSGPGVMLVCDNDGWMTSYGDPNNFTARISTTLFEGSITISAPSGMDLSVTSTEDPPATQKKALIRRLRSVSASTGAVDDHTLPFVEEIKSLLERLPKSEVSVPTRMKTLAKSLIEEPPSPSDVQDLISSTFLPTIDSMIANLRKVEGVNYEFTITPDMTGGAETIVLDDGEFYALDAILSGLKGICNIMTAYNLDVNLETVEYDPLSQINNGLFFALKEDGGATRMSNALSAFRDVVQKAESAYDFVFAEWGYAATTHNDGFETCSVLAPTKTVTDNGLKLHSYDPDRPCEWGGPYDFTPDDNTMINTFLDVAKLALAGQVTYKEEVVNGTYRECVTNGPTTVTFYSETVAAPNQIMFSITLDVTRFFTPTPLDRTDLPTFDYDVSIDPNLSRQVGEPVHSSVDNGSDGEFGTEDDLYVYCDIWETNTFPDLTFNGIFPGGFPEFDAMVYLDNTKTVVMPKEVLWGWHESGDLEVMPDGNFSLLKCIFGMPCQSRIFTIHPTNGSILADTNAISFTSAANTASHIQAHAYHSGARWAMGGYMDGSSNWHMGVFVLTMNGSTPQVSNAIPFTFSNPDDIATGDLCSDGTNLYASIAYWHSTNGRTSVVVKFNPSTTTEINESTPVLFDMSDDNYWAAWRLTYGASALWVGAHGLWKLNPTTGEVIKEYEGESGAANLYYAPYSRLVAVEGMKILFFVAP